ncbi:DUF308 domain-containing protein [Halopelagius longus]|uniref:DUF308 domain-containing protein n=1 Tax=Halopelagius longus TaxID=1236180 RepID=A0A1H0YPA1_9EURY|nr:DUF308 domain-containing protein [Halopelagius longus]RDI72602.1 DUF308 domain-containing protein [Halopelagius longus]SDQ16969.1 hypothetical protein SAMN05216278_0759 [Halopelagius longus]
MGTDGGRTPDDRSNNAHTPPDSTASDETYATNEEGQPRMTNRSRGGERVTDADSPGAGTAALLILAGVILFVFPEPVTSMAGVVLIVAGILLWGVERFA